MQISDKKERTLTFGKYKGQEIKYIDNIGESVPLLSLKQYHLYHSISTKIIRESVPQLALNRYHF